MKYTILNLNSQSEEVLPDDIVVVGIDRTWKFNNNVKFVFFTKFEAFMEFIGTDTSKYGVPMCGSELVNEANRLGRFNVLRNLIRIKKLQYCNNPGSTEDTILDMMSIYQYVALPPKSDSSDVYSVPAEAGKKRVDTTRHDKKTDNPLVSVIITHYNRSDIVRKSIESITSQTYENIEVLIVDDCSSDWHFNAISKYLSELNDSRVSLYRCSKNCGPYVCKNEMILVAQGEFITMQDSDDTSDKNRIAEQVKAMRDTNVVACSVSTYRNNTKENYKYCLAAVMYRRCVFSDIGYFDSIRYGADSEFNARTRAFYNSKQIVSVNKYMYFAGFSNDCLTSLMPQGTKPRNDYYAACLVYINNVSKSQLFTPYPIIERKFVAPSEMVVDTSDLTCTEYVIKRKSDNAEITKYDMGHMLIAFGKTYDEIGAYCAIQMRKHSSLPILVCTNIPEYLRHDKWKGVNNIVFKFFEMDDFENREIKTQLSKHTIFDKTMYIDVDSCVVSNSFMPEFVRLDTYDILMPIRAERVTAGTVDAVLKKPDKPYYNLIVKLRSPKLSSCKMTVYGGGVCFFNKTKNVNLFFDDFNAFWKISGKKMDMPALMCAAAIHSGNIKIFDLSRRHYNALDSEIVQSLHDTKMKSETVNVDNFTRARVNPTTNKWEYVKQGETEFFVKPSVTILYDIPGWAFYYMAHSIKHHLDSSYEFSLVSSANAKSISANDTDIVFIFSHAMRKDVSHIPSSMIISGMSSFKREYSRGDFEGYKIIHANNIELVNRLREIHDRVYYLPNGVDTSFFKRTDNIQEEIIVGAVGSTGFSEHKGKSAISRICEECGVKLMPLYVDPQNALTRPKMLEYYNSINLFIVNSKSETGPNPAMEAMSCGVPVISNAVGLMPVIIKDGRNGYIVDGSDESYVSVINEIKNQHRHILTMSRNAMRSMADYNWSIASNNYKKMFDDFLCSK